MTAEWLDVEGSFSMTFSEDGTGAFTGTGADGEWTEVFNWSGSGPYTITIEGESITVTLSDGAITWIAPEDCLQMTLIK